MTRSCSDESFSRVARVTTQERAGLRSRRIGRRSVNATEQRNDQAKGVAGEVERAEQA